MTRPTAHDRGIQIHHPMFNFVWHLNDVWKVEGLAREGKSLDEIAFSVDRTTFEVMELCRRNGFHLRERFGH